MSANKILGIAWPAFLAACLLELLLFGLFDPKEMLRDGQPAGLSRLAFQTAVFFVFWFACAASSALSVLLTGPAPDTGQAASRRTRADTVHAVDED
ncbi:hypothetical protein [Polaromonas sp. JS666]|uniref:hypothetical protein n=1 Tax=Polaromonas sp. (strain JS666 / ATCC BAA-500) TaxID=296591 RepID=UPI00088AF451|nr:hypothetical protein [Polaromonas sp. JS666]SDM44433.1 hypothetical protein SAMN05720382_101374 [Polaromonas sp. JS666]